MVQNLSLGPVQVHGNTPAEINLALLELQNRADEQRGLRGRALVHDRVRLSSPTEGSDGVDLQSLQQGSAFTAIALYVAPSTPLLAQPGGTTYVEIASMLRQLINFASPQSLEARLLVEGWGTESGNGKGVAVTQSDGTVIAQVVWNGQGAGLQTGAFTAVTLDTDTTVQVRVKGSSATESVLVQSLVLDMRYAIDVVV
jgi:hypothetical protein